MGVAARRRGVPRGPAVAGVEPPHPRRPPLLQPGPAGHLQAAGDTAATFEDLVIPLRVVAADLDTGDEVVFAAARSSPRCSPAPRCRASTRPIRHDGRTLVDGAVVDTVPLWHALAGPIDRIYVMNVAGDLMDRPLRSPIDVADPRLRHQPQAALRPRVAERARERRGRGAPRPRRRPRAVRLLRWPRAHGRRPRRWPPPALDEAEQPKRRRRQLRRPSGAATPRSSEPIQCRSTSGNRTPRDSESDQMSDAASRAKCRKVPGRMPSSEHHDAGGHEHDHRGGADRRRRAGAASPASSSPAR